MSMRLKKRANNELTTEKNREVKIKNKNREKGGKLEKIYY